MGAPPSVLTDDARNYDEDLDSYPIFLAGFTREVTERAVRWMLPFCLEVLLVGDLSESTPTL